MKRRAMLMGLGAWGVPVWAALSGQAEAPPLLELELRWVRRVEPDPVGTLSSRAGLPRDRHTHSTLPAVPGDLPRPCRSYGSRPAPARSGACRGAIRPCGGPR